MERKLQESHKKVSKTVETVFAISCDDFGNPSITDISSCIVGNSTTIYEQFPSIHPRKLEYLFVFLSTFHKFNLPEKYYEAHRKIFFDMDKDESVIENAIREMEIDLSLPAHYFLELKEKWTMDKAKVDETQKHCKRIFGVD